MKRLLQSYVVHDAGYYPIVAITGPRQSGKTTLVKAAFPSYAYVSLEDTDARALAVEDPRGFLARYGGPTVIDEVQRAPDLFSYLQTEVDRDDTPGRYVLTGSHNFLLMQEVAQSLAGRCGVIHLLPFSRAELEGSDQAEPRSPQDLFLNTTTRLECWETIRTGFYPRIHDRAIPPEIWIGDYLRTYLERDVRSLVNVGDILVFERFLSLCAGRAGQLLNYSSLAVDCGVSVDTAKRWVSVLRASFIVFLLRPHFSNFNKRMIRTPKLYFHDTGLAGYLLGIRRREHLVSHPLRGALFENYVVTEVVKAYMHHRLDPPVYFWRDRTGHEIDLVIEDGPALYPVEIKSGQTVSSRMFAGLRWWTDTAGDSARLPTLVYGGDDTHTRSGMAVRPWYAI